MDDYVNLQKQIDQAKKEEEKEQPPEAQEEAEEEEVLVQLKPSASFENINSSEVDSIQLKPILCSLRLIHVGFILTDFEFDLIFLY